MGDPDFLSAVFECDSGTTSTTVRSDGSASSSSISSHGEPKKQSRTMKSKLAKKTNKSADTKKPTSTKKGKSGTKPLHIRSTSCEEKQASTSSLPKRGGRSSSAGETKPSETQSRPHDSYPIEESLVGDLPTSGWGIPPPSKNSSASSNSHQLTPFFPMSPIGPGGPAARSARRGPPRGTGALPHIFSCFQDPSGRPPMSPMHRSWSPRDFQRETPFHWRQSIGGTTCYSEGDVDLP